MSDSPPPPPNPELTAGQMIEELVADNISLTGQIMQDSRDTDSLLRRIAALETRAADLAAETTGLRRQLFNERGLFRDAYTELTADIRQAVSAAFTSMDQGGMFKPEQRRVIERLADDYQIEAPWAARNQQLAAAVDAQVAAVTAPLTPEPGQ